MEEKEQNWSRKASAVRSLGLSLSLLALLLANRSLFGEEKLLLFRQICAAPSCTSGAMQPKLAAP